MGRCGGPQMIVSGWFSSLPPPQLQLLIFCREKYIVFISRDTGQISPCLFLSPSCGKNLPKCESLASVLAYVLWLPPCRYWITEFWIMFKMDTSLASTMEEFQELVKANGEELHCRLIDTTQMWVSYLSKPPPSCDITQAAQQGSVSCCDPRRLQADSVALPKRKACHVPGKQRSPWW